MTLPALLLISGLGSVAAAWGGARGGRAARAGAVAGVLALIATTVLALALEAADAADGSATATQAPWLFGSLVPTDYLRLVVALWALDALLLAGIAWLLGGMAALRGVLPATLAAIAGGTVALAAVPLALAAIVAPATGLAALAVVLGSDRAAAIPAVARELRVSLGGAALLLTAVVVTPVAATLALGYSYPTDDAGTVDPTVADAGGQAGALVGLAALAIALVVGIRAGAIPFHVRVPRLTDATAPIAGPLVLAWLPLPVAVVGLTAMDRLVTPLALSLEGERAIIAGFALLTLAAAAVAAFIADDLRHSVGYLVIADAGFVLLGLAAMDPEAWGATRVWLVTLAVSKTALAAWATVTETRFETRSLPDLRGWIRRSPVLAIGLALAVAATFGLPGWAAFEARDELARLVAGPSWGVLLVLAGFLALPAYLRILAVGLGPASTPVRRAVPERYLRSRARSELRAASEPGPSEPRPGPSASEPGSGEAEPRSDESEPGPSEPAHASAGRRVGDARSTAVAAARRLPAALRHNRTELTSLAVVTLALLAVLTSMGAIDIAAAAAEPAPAVAETTTD